MRPSYRHLLAPLAGAAVLALAACDDSSPTPAPTPTPTPTPTPANAAPVFTSAATASVAENIAAAYTATATDANSDPLAFSVSGGDDAALFQISATGALSFRAAPDFEVPRDADRNNVYSVEISVSDGKASTKLLLAVTVTDATTGSFAVRKVVGGLVMPNNLVPIPGDAARVFVTEKGGRVLILNRTTGAIAATAFLDLSGQVSTNGERGLLGFAPSPDFAANGLVYVSMTNAAGELEIRRYTTFAGDRDRANPATADLILKVPAADPDYAAGWIGFGPNGFLSVTTGGGATPNADISSLLGKVLRIDVSQDGYPADPERDYAIAAGNPGGSGRDEIFARGFRAPRTASIDRATGYMFVSDFGLGYGGAAYRGDEINMIRPQDGGLDYSPYNVRSPSCIDQDNPPGLGFPIFCNEYGIGPPMVNFFSVVAGVTYRGPVESLQGRLFTGQQTRTEIATLQNILDIRQNEFATRRNETLPGVGAVNAFGEDALGNVYFVQGNGDIYVLEPA